MKRRTFVLWGGALGTISLSMSATSAAFSFDVTPAADFRVNPEEPKASLDVTDNTENTLTTHTWLVEPIRSEADIDAITLEYPTGTSFDAVTDAEVTVEFIQSKGEYDEMKIERADYTGSNATINITDNNAELLGKARVEVVDIENPNAGTYTPSITFTDVNGNSATVDDEMGISSGSADFEFLSHSIPDRVTVGNSLTVDFEIENINTEFGSKTVALNIDGTTVDDTVVELSGGESTDTLSLTYDTATLGDTPGVDAQINIENDDSSRSNSVAVGGAFGLDLTTYKQNKDADHTWATGFLDVYDGEVDAITVEYTSADGGGGGNGNNNKGFDLTDLTTDEVTVRIERDGDNGPTEINVVNTSASESSATFDLDPNQATDIAGDVIVEIVGIKNPKDGDYEGTITLSGDDSYDDSRQFTITK